jgi:hypothetical protein
VDVQKPGLVDARSVTVLVVVSVLATTHGPEHLRVFHNFCVRAAYYLSRTDSAPESVLPTLREVVDSLNARAGYEAMVEAIRASWDHNVPAEYRAFVP